MAARSRRSAARAKKRAARRAVIGVALGTEAAAAQVRHAASGAAGIHADQKARRNGAVGATNRQGSRAARTRTAISDYA